MAFAFYSLLIPPEHWPRLLTTYCFGKQSSWGLPSSNINTHYEILRLVLYSGGHYSNGIVRSNLHSEFMALSTWTSYPTLNFL